MIKFLRGLNNKRLAVFFLVLVGFFSTMLYVFVFRSQTINSDSKSNAQSEQIPNFKHIFVIVEENYGYDDIIGNPQAEFINALANNYSVATNFSALGHPSLPNYLEMTYGTRDGINTNCVPSDADCQIESANITDRIEKSGRTWKAYFESTPESCYTTSTELYSVQHNPFVYSEGLLKDRNKCKKHVVPIAQLYADLLTDETLPNFIFIVPSMCNDMHNCPISMGDQWLSQVVPKLIDSRVPNGDNSLLIITWDETEHADSDNHIPFVLAGERVRKGYKSSKIYNHYSFLSTIENAWSLSPLTKNDKNAPDMKDMFILK